MKHIFRLFAALLFFACHPGPGPKEAVRFNDNIVFRQDTFYMHMDELIQLMGNEAEYKEVHSVYMKTIAYTQKALQYLQEQTAFDTKDEFRNASQLFFSSQQMILENEFAELIGLYSLHPEEITMKSQFQWDSVMNRIIELDSAAAESFLIQQKLFAEKYGITLREID